MSGVEESIQNLSLDDGLLHNLVLQEQAKMTGNGFDSHPPNTRKSIFNEFKGSEDFQRLYREFRTYSMMPLNDSEMDYVIPKFAGGIFQLIAFSLISGNLPAGEVLLSPESTTIFFEKLYGAKINRHIFGLSSLDIHEPDGMLILIADGIERVVALCEYTLVGDPVYFQDKYELFDKRRKDHPEYFSKAQLHFVIPDGKGPYSNRRHPEIKITYLPFTRYQFRNFIDGIYEHYAPDESATLKEIQDRAREQYERYRAYPEAGKKLTPESRDFIKRVDVMQPKR